MAKVVAALFDDMADAQQAVQDLLNNHVDRESINILSSNVTGQAPVGKSETKETEQAVFGGATAGAVAGGFAGAAIGLAALAIPGIGPVLAAGPLFMAFFGATVGSTAGSFIGAFVDLDIKNDEAEYFAEGIRRGGTLIVVKAEGADAERARSILDRHHPVNMQERMASWRDAGWTHFDPKARPFTAEQIARERALYQQKPAPTNIGELGQEDTSLSPGLVGVPSLGEEETAFRDHYQKHFAGSGRDYVIYQQAYRFGYDLANDERFADKDWSVIEPYLRNYWNDFQPGTWDQFKEAIRFARDVASGKIHE